MDLTLAISVSDQVERVGALAGAASFIGLAVLSLLYFAQAREVRRLREWAGRAPERALELEERVMANAEARREAQGQQRPPGAPARVTVSQSGATVSAGSASTVSVPAPHVTLSASPSRTSTVSFP